MTKSQKTNSELRIGANVSWNAGKSKREGQVIDIYISDVPSNLSIRHNREKDRVVVIQQRDGKVLMKLENDVQSGY